MNDTTMREMRLRNLMQRVAHTRELAARQLTERDAAIRSYGLAHPRSIAATHRLTRTQNAHRQLVRMHRVSVSDLARTNGHERVLPRRESNRPIAG